MDNFLSENVSSVKIRNGCTLCSEQVSDIVNRLGHILNWIGLAMLDLGYDPRSPFLPNLPRWKRALFIFCSFLAWWAQAKYDVI